MEDIPKIFSKQFMKSFQIKENLAEQIRLLIKSPQGSEYLSEGRFNLTEMCNLQASYWKRKNPDIKESKKIVLILRRGKKLHRFAGRWFRELPNFSGSELTLDGFDVGIPGIIGRPDFKVGTSIVEFKTKLKIPETPEDIFSLYPQDLEQLLFYSVIHISNPLENFLVFMEDTTPHKLVAFKVKIKNLEPFKKLLEERKEKLKIALETNDPTSLGRCRYYEGYCEFKKQGYCNCNKLENLPVEILKNFTEITFDQEFTNQINEIKEKLIVPEEFFTTNEVIAPRKSFVKRILDAEPEYKRNEVQEDRKDYLRLLVNRLQMNADPQEINSLEGSIKEKRLYIGKRWIKIGSSKNPEGETLPYLVKASIESRKEAPSFPGQYNLAELAIICSVYGKEKGLIFTIYPNLDDTIQVFEVQFKDMKGCLKEVRKIIDGLEKIKTTEEIMALPPCPFYMNSKRDCPITKECNAVRGIGCLIK